MKTFSINTLGCKVNQYETQQIYELLEQLGLHKCEPPTKPDLVVINTCCVTHTASAKSRQYIRKAQKLSPDAVIVGFFPNDAEETYIVKGDLGYQLKRSFYLYPFFWDRFMKISYLMKANKGEFSSKIHEFYSEEYGGKEVIITYFSVLINLIMALSKKNTFLLYRRIKIHFCIVFYI